MGKKTLVIGASENPQRYAALAINMLKQYDHEIIALGKNTGRIHGIPILAEREDFKDIDTVTLYINPKIQKLYYNYIISLDPNRVIFNPGAENPEFTILLKENNIQTENACTLVLLRTDQY